MHRTLIISAAVACLGGCSCEGRPGTASTRNDAGYTRRPQEQVPPPALRAPPEHPIPEGAMKLHAQGRDHGEAGRFAEALEHFQQARELAPKWPIPLYDTGFTYILMGEVDRAIEAYEQLDALAPQGFSDSKRLLECLRRERDGRLPAGTFREFIEVQRHREPGEVRRRLEALTRSAPGFYPAWQQLAEGAESLEERERLLAKALALEPDAESRGQLLVQRALLLQRRGEHEAARAQLQALLAEPGLPPSVATLARESLLSPGLR